MERVGEGQLQSARKLLGQRKLTEWTLPNAARCRFLLALLPLVTATNVRAEAPRTIARPGARERGGEQRGNHKPQPSTSSDFLYLKAETGVVRGLGDPQRQTRHRALQRSP